MKFSHSIALNSCPEWRQYYLAYSRLKKITYVLEKAILGRGKVPESVRDLENLAASPTNNRTPNSERVDGDSDNEDMPLLRADLGTMSIDQANTFFTLALDEELERIEMFYAEKEAELKEALNDLSKDVGRQEKQEETYLHSLWLSGQEPIREQNRSRLTLSRSQSANSPALKATPMASNRVPDDERIDIDRASRMISPPSFLPYLIWNSASLKYSKAIFVKGLISTFVLLCDLRDFAEINETAFSKVLKKYEKVIGAKLKVSYLVKVESRYPFLADTKAGLEDTIDNLIQLYARIATDGKAQLAQSELKSHLKEHIVWERNTIWRDMVEQERRRETIGFVQNDVGSVENKTVLVQLFGCNIVLPRVIPTNILAIAFASIVLFYLMGAKTFPLQQQNNCFAILAFSSILWATEAIPLFVTSIFIPVLVVMLQVMNDANGNRLDAHLTAKLIFSEMFGPVIMLLLGGFSLAAALSKHGIAKGMASVILSRAGTKPHWVLLANMFVSTFASMWISNVAAPVLCFSLIQPILRNLPHRSPYARCLVIGIAMAANVGGMASPIASPQNAISMGIMSPPPSWAEWFLIAIPICIILDLAIWGVLLLIYRPEEMQTAPPEIASHTMETFTAKQWTVIAVSVLTIVLWCVESTIETYVGDMGVIAILPIVAFYGSGILTKDDWNSMLWSVVMLAMGGIALGKAVASSGLLNEIASNLTPQLKTLSPFTCLALLSAIVVAVTSFISHTVGALIILPVVAQIGALLPDPRPRTLVMAAALMCSGGMCLPVSSFPNMNAISLEDSRGEPWLHVSDFLAVGVISSIFAWIVVVLLGYSVMSILDFN